MFKLEIPLKSLIGERVVRLLLNSGCSLLDQTPVANDLVPKSLAS